MEMSRFAVPHSTPKKTMGHIQGARGVQRNKCYGKQFDPVPQKVLWQYLSTMCAPGLYPADPPLEAVLTSVCTRLLHVYEIFQ